MADGLLERMAVGCGHLNTAHAEVVSVVADALETNQWQGWGIHSPEHWVTWQAGVSPETARKMVAIASRRAELAVSYHAFANGELTLDQMAVIAKLAAPHHDAEVAVLARSASVPQLRRVLSRYREAPVPAPQREPEAEVEPEPEASTEPTPTSCAVTAPTSAPTERCSYHWDDDGRFHLHAELGVETGAVVEQALREAHDALFRAGDSAVTWAGALGEICHRSLSHCTSLARRDRYRVFLHYEQGDGWLQAGPKVPDHIAEKWLCDGVVQPVWEREGRPVSIGRARHAIPLRTRRVVLDRDRLCRFPACSSTVGLDVHHVVMWTDGGRTDTDNLAALCSTHHDALHRGTYQASGDANRVDGITFARPDGTVIAGRCPPKPPDGPLPGPPPGHRYHHPTGERLHPDCVVFRPPPDATEHR
jgi:hypothetical protein